MKNFLLGVAAWYIFGPFVRTFGRVMVERMLEKNEPV